MIVHQFQTSDPIERRLGTGQRTPERMAGPEKRLKLLLHQLGGLVVIEPDLFAYDLALAGDVGLGQTRPPIKIGQHLERRLFMSRFYPGIKTGRLLLSEPIEIPSSALDCPGDRRGATPPASFEQQMLQKMTDAAERLRLVASAHRHPKANGHTGHRAHRPNDGAQPTGKRTKFRAFRRRSPQSPAS